MTTKIEWATHTWNAIVGCQIKSKGCTNCYAMRAAWRLGQNPKTPHYAGLTEKVNGKPVWTGKVARAPRSTLIKPLSVKASGLWFADSMSDTFYEAVPFDWVDEQFGVMALANWHIFQVLTKRPDRAATYLLGDRWEPDHTTERVGYTVLQWIEEGECEMPAHASVVASALIHGPTPPIPQVAYPRPDLWPLPNVWIGVSVEDQASADERREDLRRIAEAGWTTFVSYEPAVGPVDWTGWDFVDQIISGGESGPDARPSHPDWHRATRDFCAGHGIAFFFKQWGSFVPVIEVDVSEGCIFDSTPSGLPRLTDEGWRHWLANRSVQRVDGPRETVAFMRRIGKARAGRMLDGVEHNGFPKPENQS